MRTIINKTDLLLVLNRLDKEEFDLEDLENILNLLGNFVFNDGTTLYNNIMHNIRTGKVALHSDGRLESLDYDNSPSFKDQTDFSNTGIKMNYIYVDKKEEV